MVKIALYGRSTELINRNDFIAMLTKLRQRADLLIYEPFCNYLKEAFTELDFSQYTVFNNLSSLSSADYIVSAGGDGTFLEAARFAVASNIPILGVNFGRMGFLAQVHSGSADSELDALFAGKLEIEFRTLLSASINGNVIDSPALNEITLQRNNPSMIKTVVDINGKLLSSYWSDGLIISTPTGSTAYSLSVGGPIITPENKNIVITPVAPHNLNIRPIVLTDDVCLTVKVYTRIGKAMFSADNYMCEVDSESVISIKKSNRELKFVKLLGYDYYKILHTKLNWGVDIRN